MRSLIFVLIMLPALALGAPTMRPATEGEAIVAVAQFLTQGDDGYRQHLLDHGFSAEGIDALAANATKMLREIQTYRHNQKVKLCADRTEYDDSDLPALQARVDAQEKQAKDAVDSIADRFIATLGESDLIAFRAMLSHEGMAVYGESDADSLRSDPIAPRQYLNLVCEHAAEQVGDSQQ